MSQIPPPQTILGIPGLWKSHSEIVTSIARDSGGYLFAGKVMMHMATKTHFEVDIYERDESLVQAFAIAGEGRFTDEQLARIGKHTFCIYLVGQGGSTAVAQRFLDAGTALLQCGGLGVKVESTGKAHPADVWRALTDARDAAAMLEAYVTYVGENGSFYSCGMHNLGYPDCIVEANIAAQDAATLLYAFLGYLLTESPTLHSGETFSIAAEAPCYRLFKEDCRMFAPGDPFHNPFGVWKMIPA